MLPHYLTDYNFNLPLDDALADPELSITRRILAGASCDTQLQDGYFSAYEMMEAFKVLVQDRWANVDPEESLGSAMIEHLLAGEGDDYQRRIYYMISEIDVNEAFADLTWLVDLLRKRVGMLDAFDGVRVALPTLPGRMAESAWDDETQTWNVDRAIGVRPFGYD